MTGSMTHTPSHTNVCKVVKFHLTFPRLIKHLIQSNLPLRSPLLSDHLSLATTFPKFQKFSSQITIDGTSRDSRRRPPPVSDHF